MPTPKPASKKCFLTCKLWLSIWWTHLGKPKAAFENNQALVARSQNQNTFWNRYSFATRAVLYIRLPLPFNEQSGRDQVRYSDTSKCLSRNFEDQYTFWKYRSFTFDREKIVQLFLFHAKFDVNVSASPSINIRKQISVSFSPPITKLLSFVSNYFQNYKKRNLFAK